MSIPNPDHVFSLIVRERIDGPSRALHFASDGVSSLDTSPELNEAVKDVLSVSVEHEGEPVTLIGKLIGAGHGGGGFATLDKVYFVVTHALFFGKLVDHPDVIDQLCPNSPFPILPILSVETRTEGEDEADPLRFLRLVWEQGVAPRVVSPFLLEFLGIEHPGNGAEVDLVEDDYEREGFDPFYTVPTTRFMVN